jgi:hypothetical protein
VLAAGQSDESPRGRRDTNRWLSGMCLVREFEAAAETVPSKVARSA